MQLRVIKVKPTGDQFKEQPQCLLREKSLSKAVKGTLLGPPKG